MHFRNLMLSRSSNVANPSPVFISKLYLYLFRMVIIVSKCHFPLHTVHVFPIYPKGEIHQGWSSAFLAVDWQLKKNRKICDGKTWWISIQKEKLTKLNFGESDLGFSRSSRRRSLLSRAAEMYPLPEAIRSRLHSPVLEEPENVGPVCVPSHGLDVSEAHHGVVRVHAAGGRVGSQAGAENG